VPSSHPRCRPMSINVCQEPSPRRLSPMQAPNQWAGKLPSRQPPASHAPAGCGCICGGRSSGTAGEQPSSYWCLPLTASRPPELFVRSLMSTFLTAYCLKQTRDWKLIARASDHYQVTTARCRSKTH